ncbi:tetratricopeptide repeat protein [Pseudomonas baetica]|uniref:tetratricopeptide repeat protein n=1 Tax=Pseudomonas baetica TaxID=674054 RepID=UPI003EE8A138
MPTKRYLLGFLVAFYAAASHCSFAAERKTTPHSNNASTALIESASQLYANGQLDQAASTLERALHIQPNNPATLHYLGVLRLQQGQYQQAETLAVRSNMRVGQNVALRNRNLQLIQAAQNAQASNNPPNAGERLAAVQQGLEEEVKQRREAEGAAAGNLRETGALTLEPATQVAAQPTMDSSPAERNVPMAAVQPAPVYDEVEIPRGHWPPPGKCRIWFPDRPPGHQPKPGKCKKLRDRVPAGAYLVRG